MIELELSWDLTPTERRVAEVAFANSRIDFDPMARAYDAVMAVRSLRGDIRDRMVSLMEREKMLAELRREPQEDARVTHDQALLALDCFEYGHQTERVLRKYITQQAEAERLAREQEAAAMQEELRREPDTSVPIVGGDAIDVAVITAERVAAQDEAACYLALLERIVKADDAVATIAESPALRALRDAVHDARKELGR